MENKLQEQDNSGKTEKIIKDEMNSSKTTISVPEMRKLLGLKKTDSYWLVHRNFFETKIIGGKMRIDVRSFEKWYANQVKHKKVNGEAPGTELMKNSYSFKDAANLLEMYDTDLYAIWNREGLETITVDYVRRIPIDVFEKWYQNQTKYHKVDKLPTIAEMESEYITLQEGAKLLGIKKEKLLVMTRSGDFKDLFVTRVFNSKKWISKESFQQFLNAQDDYQIVKNPIEKLLENDDGMETKELITRQEAAALAGVTTATITKWIGMERFAYIGAGKVLRICRKEFLEWLKEYQKGGA